METFIDAALKTALYLGAVLLLGAGVFRRFVGPELAQQMRRTLRFGTIFGALLLIFSSLSDVTWRVTELIGRFDAGFILEYTLATRHGHATLVRLVLVLFMLVLGLMAHRPTRMGNWLFALSGLGILGTFSFLSHAATLHGPPALLADLGHFTAATLWGGAVLYVSLSPAWRRQPIDEPADEALVGTMKRVSSLGLCSVLLLTTTGIYASLLHLEQPAQLITTPYGLALTVKLALVSVILGIAALNRWWFLPALQKGSPQRLGQMLRLEAILLITVFAATGLLTTRAPPHTLTSSSAKVVTIPYMFRSLSLLALLPVAFAATPQASLPTCGYEDRPATLTSYDDWPYTLLDTLYALPNDYAPSDLEPVTSLGVGTDAMQLRSLVLPDLEALLEAAEADGMGLEVQSAYRSYNYQVSTFNSWVEQDGYDAALKSSARPGHSEHQLGTALDFRSADGPPAWDLDDWAETPEGAWLQGHAADFGFVMSYPEGKDALTCYIYEPWHYRYVGREVAAEVAASGLTLREWLWQQQN